MQTFDRIKAISFKEELVGKLVGISKKKLSWTFENNGAMHTISLSHSLFSYKFNFIYDQHHKFKGQRSFMSKFEYETKVDGIQFKIRESLFTFELFINGILFRPGMFLKPNDRQEIESLRQINHQPRLSFRETPRISFKAEENSLKSQFKSRGTAAPDFENQSNGNQCFNKKKVDDGTDRNTQVEQNQNVFQNDKQMGGSKTGSERTTNTYLNNQIGITLYPRPFAGIKRASTVNDFHYPPRDTIKNETISNKQSQHSKSLLWANLDAYETSKETFYVSDFTVYTSLEKHVLKEMF